MAETKSVIVVAIVVSLIVGLIVGGVSGYFISKSIHKNFPGQGFNGNFQNRNFQINDNAKSEVTSVFENNTDAQAIQNYCSQNKMNCFYYCGQINSNNQFCDQIQNMTRGRQWQNP